MTSTLGIKKIQYPNGTNIATLDSSGSIAFAGASTVAGTLGVTGETTLATHLNMGDNDKIKLGASGDLEIYHDASNSYVDDTGTGRLYLRGNDRVQIQKYTGDDMITAIADGAVKLYYDNAKKFETTSAGATVTGNLTVTDGHVSSGVTHTYNLFGATGTGGSAAYVTYSFVGDGNTGMYSGTADTIKFATGGTEKVRIHSNGVLSASAGIALGVSTANTASNVLDDYEEGTWTPVCQYYEGTPTIENAFYTKIGRQVVFSCKILLDGTSDGSNFRITGLPFTTLNSGSGVFGAFLSYSNSSAVAYSLIGANQSQINNYTSSGNNISYNTAGADKEFRFVGMYITP